MGGDSSFQQKWVEKGDRPWLKSVPNLKTSAFCSYCDSKFSVKSGGISSVKAHENGNNHRDRVEDMSTNRQIGKGASNELKVTAKPAVGTFEDQILSAEVIEVLNKVDKNQSFKSADDDNEKFARQFPDSKIAQNYEQGQTKLQYVAKFGIAPYVKELLLEDMAREQYCFHFDETTTAQVKKQYDGYITYYSKKSNQITCSYAGSLFVGHCPASALLDHFYHFIKDLNLDLDNLLNLGMDGPNVNLKFARELKEELELDDTSFIDTGGCSLHTVHNAFGKGMNALKETMDLDQLVIDLHFFFKKSAARREDLVGMSALTDVTVHYLLRHCESRWLGIEKVLVRVIEQLKNIKTYFLQELPKKPEFKGAKGIGKTRRYERIAECLKNKSLESLMAFVVFVAQDFTKYLIPLQTNAPMVHVIYSMQVKLVHALMSKFIDSKFLLDDATKKILTAKQLMDVDVTDKRKHVSKVQVGAKATSLMKGLEPLEKKKTVAAMVGFLEACTSYLLKNLPLTDKVLKKAKCLHPENRHNAYSLSNISFLAQSVCKALGEKAMKESFNLRADQTKYDLLDLIRSEYQSYQMETIPETMFRTATEPTKKSVPQKSSYWKRAYEIAGIFDDDGDHDEKFRRIDDYWFEVSNICDENGVKKYSHLWVLVKCILVISHGNADPERGFSINKHMLSIHGYSLGEDTIVALRLVKDYIIECGGIGKVVLTDALLSSCSKASARYKADLDEKRKLKEKEEAARIASVEASAAAKAAEVSQKKKEEELKEVEKEVKALQAGLDVADETSKEASQQLKDVLNNNTSLSKAKFVEQVARVEAKIDMANKRKAQLSEDMKVVLEKKRKIE